MAAKEIATTNWYTDASLKAYYRFSTGALTTDSSGESHTLTDIGDPAEVDGVFGKAADFDANDAYSAVDHADFKPTGAFSVGAWIKTTKKTTTTRPIFQSYSANTNRAGFVVYIYNGTFSAFIGKNTGTTVNVDYKSIGSSKDLADGNWHFVAFTYDGSYMKLYADGVSVATPVAWEYPPAYAATNYIRVACYNTTGTNTNYLNSGGALEVASLDDLFLINGTALTAEQINHIYTGINIKKINGLSNYSLKSSNGLAKESIKSFNSL
jgi:hypothetical protein